MQILVSVIINIILLAVVLPLFYVYIVSKARERLEKETMSKAREEIEALVKEFNNIALSRISILEDAIVRANRLASELNGKNYKEPIKEKSSEDNQIDIVLTENNKNLESKNQGSTLDIRIEDEGNENNIETKIPDKDETNNLDKDIKLNEDIKNENKEDKINKEEIKDTKKEKTKKNNIDTAIKAIDDEAKKEVIEKLRSKLDKTIKNNIPMPDKDTSKKTNKIQDEESSDRNQNIISLYKEGLSKEEIAKKLNCSITEIDIVIDLELE